MKIKNEIKRINHYELNEIINKKKEDCLLVLIDGNKIKTRQDYLSFVSKVCKFPFGFEDNWDAYADWMTDFTFIEKYYGKKESFIFIFENFSNFMKDNKEDKEIVIEYFEESILPFWEEDVKYTVVDGYPKSFNVYLID